MFTSNRCELINYQCRSSTEVPPTPDSGPSTFSTMMYYTKQDIDGNDIFVEKDRNARMKQKLEIIQPNNKKINNIDSRKFNYSKRTNLKYSNNNKYSNNKFRIKY